MITINISDFYGLTKAYRNITEDLFGSLESAYLNGEETIEVSYEQYEQLTSDLPPKSELQ